MSNNQLEFEVEIHSDTLEKKIKLAKDTCYFLYTTEKKILTEIYKKFLENSQDIQNKVNSKQPFISIHEDMEKFIKNEFSNLPKIHKKVDIYFYEYMKLLRIKNTGIFLLKNYEEDRIEMINNEVIQSKLGNYNPKIYLIEKSFIDNFNEFMEEELNSLNANKQKLDTIEKNGIKIIYPMLLEFLKYYIPIFFAIYQYFNYSVDLDKLLIESKQMMNDYEKLVIDIKKSEQEIIQLEQDFKDRKTPEEIALLKIEYDTYQPLFEKKESARKIILEYPDQALYTSYEIFENNPTALNLIHLCESIIPYAHNDSLYHGNYDLESVIDTFKDLYPQLREEIHYLQGADLMLHLRQQDVQYVEKNTKMIAKLNTKNEIVANTKKNIEDIEHKINNISKENYEDFFNKIENPIGYLYQYCQDIYYDKPILNYEETLDNYEKAKELSAQELERYKKDAAEFRSKNQPVIEQHKEMHEKMEKFFHEKTAINLLSLYEHAQKNEAFTKTAQLLEKLYPHTLSALLAKDQRIIAGSIVLSNADIKDLKMLEGMNPAFKGLNEKIIAFSAVPTWANYDELRTALIQHKDYYQYGILESLTKRCMDTIISHDSDAINMLMNELAKKSPAIQASSPTVPYNKNVGHGLFDKPVTVNDLNAELDIMKQETRDSLLKQLQTYNNQPIRNNQERWNVIRALYQNLQQYIPLHKPNPVGLSTNLAQVMAIIEGKQESSKLAEHYHTIHTSIDKLPEHPIQAVVRFMLEKLEETDEYKKIPTPPSYNKS